MAVIQRLVASGGATASFDFTSIAATYESLVLEISGAGDTAATSVEVRIRFNNDSTANHYYSGYHVLNTGGTGVAGDVTSTGGHCGPCVGSTAPTSAQSGITITIGGYARTVFRKAYRALFGYAASTGTAGQNHGVAEGLWLDTSAINQVTVYPASGNWADGTTATLYGIAGS